MYIRQWPTDVGPSERMDVTKLLHLGTKTKKLLKEATAQLGSDPSASLQTSLAGEVEVSV